jgi:hypothetical protein
LLYPLSYRGDCDILAYYSRCEKTPPRTVLILELVSLINDLAFDMTVAAFLMLYLWTLRHIL